MFREKNISFITDDLQHMEQTVQSNIPAYTGRNQYAITVTGKPVAKQNLIFNY